MKLKNLSILVIFLGFISCQSKESKDIAEASQEELDYEKMKPLFERYLQEREHDVYKSNSNTIDVGEFTRSQVTNNRLHRLESSKHRAGY